MTNAVVKPKSKRPSAVLEIKTTEDGVKTMCLNKDAMPARAEDDVLILLASQVLSATRINQHTDAEAIERYDAVIAALNEIDPQGPIEGMLATQLITSHMATMDCYGHANKTGERKTHEYHLNQVSKLSRTHVALLDALNRHRGKTGQQKVTVEHVHVHQGGQAIVGHVEQPGGGEQASRGVQSHAPMARKR